MSRRKYSNLSTGCSQGLAMLMQKYEGHFFHRVLQEDLKEVLEGCGHVIIHDAMCLPQSKSKEVLKALKMLAVSSFGNSPTFTIKT